MCNLNLIIKNNVFVKNKKDLNNLNGFLIATTSNSFINNDDGEGCFLSYKNTIIKQLDKINYLNYSEQINKSNFVLTHQRLSTSGFNNEYTHPIFNKEFILFHNGVLKDYAYKNHSDTYNLFKKFNKEFNKLRNMEFNKSKPYIRENLIKKVIKEIFKDIKGSFSIALFDKLENNLYYFKNDVTTINLYKNKDMVFLTTSYTNDIFLSMFNKKFKEYEIKDYKIYKINLIKNKIKIKIIENIPQPKTEIIKPTDNIKITEKKNNTYNNYTYENGYHDYYGYNDYVNNKEFKIIDTALKCFGCEKLTHQTRIKDNKPLCVVCSNSRIKGLEVLN